MPAGRKPIPSTDVITVDTTHVAHQIAAANDLGPQVTAVMREYGRSLPYDRERLISIARVQMDVSAAAMLEAGQALICIKENEPYGAFEEIVCERLNLAPRTARQMMAAAAKYLSPALRGKQEEFRRLGPTKLYDLMLESDDDLEMFAKGGTIAGVTFDEVERMTSRELRKALRDARQQIDAKDQRSKKDAKRIVDLQDKVERLETGAIDEGEEAQIALMRAATLQAESAIAHLASTFDTIVGNPSSRAVSTQARGDMEYIAKRLSEAWDARQLQIDLDLAWGEQPQIVPIAENSRTRKGR